VSHSKRYNGLDTLRALAIVLVFMYHYQAFVSGEATFGWGSTLGWVGVDLFFVLSGYLIANQLFGGLAAGRTLSLKAFYARRLLRTLPNYWVVLALFFLFPAVMGGREPPALWRFVSFTQNIGLQPGTAFSHAWSLCIEEQFYLVLPAVALLGVGVVARRGRSMWLAWALLVGLMVAAAVTRAVLWFSHGSEVGGAVAGYYPHIYYASWCRADEFLPGVAVAMLKNFHPEAWARWMQRGPATLAGGGLATALMGWGLYHFYYVDGQGYGFWMTALGYAGVALCFALLLVAALSPGSLLYRWRVPGAASLAAWSYAIYLVHKPVEMILRRQLPALGLAPSSLGAVVLITTLSLLVGWLLYRGVERPFMALRERHWPGSFAPRASPSLAAAAVPTP